MDCFASYRSNHRQLGLIALINPRKETIYYIRKRLSRKMRKRAIFYASWKSPPPFACSHFRNYPQLSFDETRFSSLENPIKSCIKKIIANGQFTQQRETTCWKRCDVYSSFEENTHMKIIASRMIILRKINREKKKCKASFSSKSNLKMFRMRYKDRLYVRVAKKNVK